jgi:nucleoside-diphosphate-sugar epimerase
VMGTEARGASNAKAKRELGWEPRYPSWREGFRAAYASATEGRAAFARLST